jgi:hypothetical protein
VAQEVEVATQVRLLDSLVVQSRVAARWAGRRLPQHVQGLA